MTTTTEALRDALREERRWYLEALEAAQSELAGMYPLPDAYFEVEKRINALAEDLAASEVERV